MIVSSKNYREKYPRKENAFEHEEKKPGLNLIQGYVLSAFEQLGPGVGPEQGFGTVSQTDLL